MSSRSFSGCEKDSASLKRRDRKTKNLTFSVTFLKFAHYIRKEEINMTNSEFMKILNDDSLELTVEELENIIEEELQKTNPRWIRI